MKGSKIITILIIVNLILVGIIYNLIIKININNKKQVIKEMSETEYEDNITELNQSHEDYANYIEESKKKIAKAITDMGVETSNEETLETMATKIKKIEMNNSEKIDFTEYSQYSIPSNTNWDPTKRTWIKGTHVIGIAPTNYYQTSNSSMTINSNSSITTTTHSAGYYSGIVLNDDYKAGDTISVILDDNGNNDFHIYAVTYEEDGTQISRPNIVGRRYTIPENAYYIVLIFGLESATLEFNNVEIIKF